MQDDEEEPPLTLDEILGLIRSPATEDRIDGLIELSLLIDSAYGEEGAAIGQWVRQSGALQLLAWLVVDSSAEVQQQSLLVLGNLCSDACDPNSTLTKSMLLQQGGQRALLLALRAEDPTVLVYVCGCLQNLCDNGEWAEYLVSEQAEKRLEQLLTHDNHRVVHYAAGALKNMMNRVGRSAELKSMAPDALKAIEKRERDALLGALRYRRAVRLIKNFARNINPEKRLERVLAASNRPKVDEAEEAAARAAVKEAKEAAAAKAAEEAAAKGGGEGGGGGGGGRGPRRRAEEERRG